jgi:hypothetical protein
LGDDRGSSDGGVGHSRGSPFHKASPVPRGAESRKSHVPPRFRCTGPPPFCKPFLLICKIVAIAREAMR